jgi:hypothetical protein
VGSNQLSGLTVQPIVYTFTNAGVYTVTGTCIPPQGAPQSGSITVTVVASTFTNNPDCWAGQKRIWNLPTVAAQAVLEADARLLFEQTGDLANNGRQMGLLTGQNEPRYIVSRLGTNGPVLASARAHGFQLWSSTDTYVRVIQRYSDGSQLVEMLLILSPTPSDIVVRLDTIVGGVTFEDGTISKLLSPADFDALGRHAVRFIRPATARTSVCHSIKVFQGSDLVGYRR